MGVPALEEFEAHRLSATSSTWCFVSIEDVRRKMASTGYPRDRVHLVKGLVEKTIPSQLPEHIALAWIDTDWYRSTRHKLEHLYPRLVSGGVLLVDHYGHFGGCRKAVDEFFAAREVRPYMHRIDYTGRLIVKP